MTDGGLRLETLGRRQKTQLMRPQRGFNRSGLDRLWRILRHLGFNGRHNIFICLSHPGGHNPEGFSDKHRLDFFSVPWTNDQLTFIKINH